MYVWKHSKYGKDEYKIYVLRYPIKNYYINILLKTQYIVPCLISPDQTSTSNLKYGA